MFIMSEIATLMFEETPMAFGRDIRAARYPRTLVTDPAVIAQCASLGAPAEASAAGSPGVTLLPARVILACLIDRRRSDLVVPFKLALIDDASAEANRALRRGDASAALPAALLAVERAQDLHATSGSGSSDPSVELFQPYALAARANLACGRAKPCEDFLSLASWLTLKHPDKTTNEMRATLARTRGALAAHEGDDQSAARWFAEDAYWRAEAHGPESAQCGSAYVELHRAFERLGERAKARATAEAAVFCWLESAAASLLGEDLAAAGASAKQLRTEPRADLGFEPAALAEAAAALEQISAYVAAEHKKEDAANEAATTEGGARRVGANKEAEEASRRRAATSRGDAALAAALAWSLAGRAGEREGADPGDDVPGWRVKVIGLAEEARRAYPEAETARLRVCKRTSEAARRARAGA